MSDSMTKEVRAMMYGDPSTKRSTPVLDEIDKMLESIDDALLDNDEAQGVGILDRVFFGEHNDTEETEKMWNKMAEALYEGDHAMAAGHYNEWFFHMTACKPNYRPHGIPTFATNIRVGDLVWRNVEDLDSVHVVTVTRIEPVTIRDGEETHDVGTRIYWDSGHMDAFFNETVLYREE